MTAPIPNPSEPTVYEMIRTLSRQMDEQRQATTRVETVMMSLVTQEQRMADRELDRLRYQELEKDLGAVQERSTWTRRASLVGVGFPIVVAAIMYVSGAVVAMPSA